MNPEQHLNVQQVGSPQEQSPELRYAQLHRDLERGLESERAYADLARVCIELGKIGEAAKTLRHVQSPELTLEITRLLATQGVIAHGIGLANPAGLGSAHQRAASDPRARALPQPPASRGTVAAGAERVASPQAMSAYRGGPAHQRGKPEAAPAQQQRVSPRHPAATAGPQVAVHAELGIAATERGPYDATAIAFAPEQLSAAAHAVEAARVDEALFDASPVAAAQPAQDAPTETKVESAHETVIERYDEGTVLGELRDAGLFLLQDHMPIVTLVMTLAFPLAA
ncbi:MAG TPA: hypothetical protein PKE00_15970, partial [Planctomycetota bacterium]|nr:hypothetical protein [Planctomycetota bacterium]